jgi:hypothetical protein
MSVRTAAQRRADTLAALSQHRDVWVASADAAGAAYMIPLSYLWDGERLILATPEASRTARNLSRAGSARVALPSPDDVVIIDGAVEVVPIAGAADFADAFAAAAGFDPRAESGVYAYIRITPTHVQAWRDVAELRGRTIMREGRWLDDRVDEDAGAV